MTTGKTIALTIWTFVCKVVALLFNMLSRFVIAILPRSKHLLISWLQSPSALNLEPPKIKSVIFPYDFIGFYFLEPQKIKSVIFPLFPLFPHLFPMK